MIRQQSPAGMCRHPRNSRAAGPTTLLPVDAPPSCSAALPARAPHLGGPARQRWSQARHPAPDACALHAPFPPRPPPRPRHAPRASRTSLAALSHRLRRDSAGDRRGGQGLLPRGRLLGPDRPRPPPGGGRWDACAHPRYAGPGHPLRTRHQPRCPPPRPRLAAPLSCPLPAYTAGGAGGARLRVAQFSQAPAGGAGHRSPQLGAVVRWLGGGAAGAGRAVAGRPAPDVAGGGRVAPRRGAHRLPRISGGGSLDGAELCPMAAEASVGPAGAGVARAPTNHGLA
jgi:hypothetical protein